MTSSRDGTAAAAPVLLITAWHLARMRSMPLSFVRVRRLDFATRGRSGCLWVHRWISRRSLLLTTAWRSPEAASAWLDSAEFRETDAALMRLRGTAARVERYVDGVELSPTAAPHERPPAP